MPSWAAAGAPKTPESALYPSAPRIPVRKVVIVTALLEKPAFIVLIVVIILLFGAKRLPDLARSVGRSARILKQETEALTDPQAQAGSESAALATNPPAVSRQPQ